MRRVHCEGCGFTEDDGIPKPKMKKIKLSVVNDDRFPSGTETHQADLCPDCISRCLATYFGQSASGTLELPSFIHPVPEPQSVRA